MHACTQAMRHGLLHKRLPNKGLVVDMRLLNTVRTSACVFVCWLYAHSQGA